MSNNPRHLEQWWVKFKDATVPAKASKGQVADLRDAFFAGALSSSKLLIDGAREANRKIAADPASADEVDENGASLISQIQEELQLYVLGKLLGVTLDEVLESGVGDPVETEDTTI